MVPETDLARLPYGKDRICCIFEKGEQLRFQHDSHTKTLLWTVRYFLQASAKERLSRISAVFLS